MPNVESAYPTTQASIAFVEIEAKILCTLEVLKKVFHWDLVTMDWFLVVSC